MKNGAFKKILEDLFSPSNAQVFEYDSVGKRIVSEQEKELAKYCGEKKAKEIARRACRSAAGRPIHPSVRIHEL